MKWEAPDNPERTLLSYAKEAAELRANPGEWGVVTEFPLIKNRNSENPARGVAYDINRGRYVAFRPKGAFQAVSRIGTSDEGKPVIKVHARYIEESDVDT